MSIHANRLVKEKSPYLQQHAKNPIDWYPWGEEAFEKARLEDKPIFLSIGYATCHWCHVMAKESFEDETVADLLNDSFISIKVDREERPDIDSLYMKVAQMMTGRGGWPLTVLLTPDQVPFFAGTYFPKESRNGVPGLLDVLPQMKKNYQNDKEKLASIETSVRSSLLQTIPTPSATGLGKSSVASAYRALEASFDSHFGGFGTGQKFPQPQNLLFLLHYYAVKKEPTALAMVERTVQGMIRGGIWDHVEFGFSRYTVDRRWIVPHFEKMLYDNALLLTTLATLYQITKRPVYKDIAAKLVAFLDQRMTNEDGAFYSAIDADSVEGEGAYYVYSYSELTELLSKSQLDTLVEKHGASERGNFEGKNILLGDSLPEEIRTELATVRAEREHPFVDDKILSGWNSLMIVGLARAARIFDEPSYLERAQKALAFMEEKMVHNDRLYLMYRGGETQQEAMQDDYAFLVWAYTELYEATLELDSLQHALTWTRRMEDLFWDKENGGFFRTGTDQETLLIREKENLEGAMPSGNGVMALLYARFYAMTGEAHYRDQLDFLQKAFAKDAKETPAASVTLLSSVLFTEFSSLEVVVIGGREDALSLTKRFAPNVVLLFGESSEAIEKIAPFAAAMKQLNNATTYYVCEQFACQQPTTDFESVTKMLLGKS